MSIRGCTARTGAALRTSFERPPSRRISGVVEGNTRLSNRTLELTTPSFTQYRTLNSISRTSPGFTKSFGKPTLNPISQHVRQYRLPTPPQGLHRAYIALGSNMGDKVAMIEQACKEMDAGGKIKVLRTSSLWETRAMYVLDQDNFVNAVCVVDTSLPPIELLDELQSIENRMGRVKVIDKGPRNIDLDILLYDEEIISQERLQIPHPLMLEREFVLRPLFELVFESTFEVFGGQTVSQFLKKLPKSEPPLIPFTPLPRGLPPITTHDSKRATRIMSVLNVTPDSFSDGGKNYNIDKSALTATVKSHIAAGATIIDIGGESTRPTSVPVSPEEELSRVLPAIQIIRSLPEADHIAISVDTYRALVAEAAVKAGADIVNDISGGTLDVNMLPTVAKLGCTICLMHMRGTPQTMQKNTDYGRRGLLQTVGRELGRRRHAAEVAGIHRWRIILDPGIGFAKTQAHNLLILDHGLNYLRNLKRFSSIPWLVGTSRKGFIGTITGVEQASERKWGTAAAVTAAIKGGADIVRVHDVEEMTMVAKMADAIYRAGEGKDSQKHADELIKSNL